VRSISRRQLRQSCIAASTGARWGWGPRNACDLAATERRLLERALLNYEQVAGGPRVLVPPYVLSARIVATRPRPGSLRVLVG